jgi:hypothetical protein
LGIKLDFETHAVVEFVVIRDKASIEEDISVWSLALLLHNNFPLLDISASS